jgi:ribosomal protein S27E
MRHFICPNCRSTLVRPILVNADTIRLLCDDCDHEWTVARDPKVRVPSSR